MIMKHQQSDAGNKNSLQLSDGGRLWTIPLLENIATSVESFSAMHVLILGAGNNALGEHLMQQGAWVVSIDIEQKTAWNIANGCCFVVATSELLPFKDSSFDIIISCSTFQYVLHDSVFSEIFRVGKNSAIILLHENMPFNPVILIYRTLRRIQSLWNTPLLLYLKSIRRYLRSSDLPLDLYIVERVKRYYLFGALNQFLHKSHDNTLRWKFGVAIEYLDKFLLKTCPFLGAFCWLGVYRLRIKK